MISLLRNISLLKIGNPLVINCCDACLNLSSVPKLAKPDSFGKANTTVSRLLHSSASHFASHFKARDRRELLKTVAKFDEGVEGEKVVSLDAIISRLVFVSNSSCNTYISRVISDSSFYVHILMLICFL